MLKITGKICCHSVIKIRFKKKRVFVCQYNCYVKLSEILDSIIFTYNNFQAK